MGAFCESVVFVSVRVRLNLNPAIWETIAATGERWTLRLWGIREAEPNIHETGANYFGVAEERVSAAWPFTFTESQIWAMRPSLSMRKVLRTMPLKLRPMNFFMRHWP